MFRKTFGFAAQFAKRLAILPAAASGSYCIKDGKDKIIFASAEDHKKPVKDDVAALLNFEEDDEEPGFMLPNGDINWQCPCMAGMISGPCGYQFRQAFSCFHYSKGEPKGAECVDLFHKMSLCMANYPVLYPYAEKTENDDESEYVR